MQHLSDTWLHQQITEQEKAEAEAAAPASASESALTELEASLRTELSGAATERAELAAALVNSEAQLRAMGPAADGTAAALTQAREELAPKQRLEEVESQLAEMKASVEQAGDSSAVETKLQQLSETTTASLAGLREEMAAASAARQAELAAQVDVDGDGSIDKSEFSRWAGEQAARASELESRLAAAMSEAQASTAQGSESAARLDSLEAANSSSLAALNERLDTVSSSLEEVREEVREEEVRWRKCERSTVETKERVDTVEGKLAETQSQPASAAAVEDPRPAGADFDAALREVSDSAAAALAQAQEGLAPRQRLEDVEAQLAEIKASIEQLAARETSAPGQAVDAAVDPPAARTDDAAPDSSTEQSTHSAPKPAPEPAPAEQTEADAEPDEEEQEEAEEEGEAVAPLPEPATLDKPVRRPPPGRRRYSMSLTQGALDDFLSVVDLPESVAEEEDSDTLEVTCPEGVSAGDVIYLQYDDQEIEVTVPEGVEPGDEFEVNIQVRHWCDFFSVHLR